MTLFYKNGWILSVTLPSAGELLQGSHEADSGRGAVGSGDLHFSRPPVALLAAVRARQARRLPRRQGASQLRRQRARGVRGPGGAGGGITRVSRLRARRSARRPRYVRDPVVPRLCWK